MKRIPVLTALTALLALWTITVLAAVPHLISFQGALRDANGVPVADGAYPVKFEIFNSVGPGGGCLWLENQSVTTQGGLFSVVLGSNGQGIPDTAFNAPDRWLAITVGNDPEITPRQRLTSVGYSYRVGTVDGATGGTIFGNTSIQSDLAVAGAMDAKNLVLKQPGPTETPLSIQGSSGQTADLMVIKDGAGATLGSFDPKGSFFSRYALFAHAVHCSESLKVDGNVAVGGNFQTSGISEVAGNDIMVTLGMQHLAPVGIGTAPSADVALRVQSGTTLHELGHNLRLRHDGGLTPLPPSDDFLQAVDALGNKVVSIDALGNMTLDGDMDGLTSSWENVHAIDINCDGMLNANGGVIVGGNVGIGTPAANSKLHVGGAIATAVTIVSSPTSSITLGASHSMVLCNAVFEGITVNLPTAVGIAGRQYTIKLIFSNFGYVTIDPFGNESIEGAATYSLGSQYKYATIVSDGANWWIIANN